MKNELVRCKCGAILGKWSGDKFVIKIQKRVVWIEGQYKLTLLCPACQNKTLFLKNNAETIDNSPQI